MKFYDLLNTGLDYFKNENFNGAIKKYNKAIKINSKYADAYYLRGTAKLYKYDFDDAKLDLDTAIMIEPLYGEAFANRAFSLIQKYEFQGSRVLKEFNGVTVMAGKSQTTIPDDDLKRICFDLNRANELESNNKMIIDAIAKYCNKK
jgi:tetratricopeptide (TPR) repeat protein